MHRCRCSTGALESFIQDFAGLNLRQQRAQRFFQQHHRRFNARPYLQQSEISSDEQKAADEAFDKFHVPDELLGKSAGTNSEERGVKCEDVRQDAPQTTPVRKEASQTILELPAISQHIPLPKSTILSSHGNRRAARQFRKLRRIQEGKYPLGARKGSEKALCDLLGPAKEFPGKAYKILHPESLDNDAVEDHGRQSRVDELLEKLMEIHRSGGQGSMDDIFEKLEGKARRKRVTPKDMEKMFSPRPSSELFETVDEIQDPGRLNHDAVGGQVGKRRKNDRGPRDEGESDNILEWLTDKSKEVLAQKSKTKDSKSDTSKTAKHAPSTKPSAKPKKEPWQITKSALKAKFGETGWQPRKRLSPDTLEGIRALHASDPATYSTATLATHFQITPEAIRRILKSKWQPSSKESEKRMERWERRGARKWGEMAEQGMRPPKRWRAMGVGKEGEERDGGQERRSDGKRKTVAERRWDEAVDAADRLPMEGSFADRIL